MNDQRLNQLFRAAKKETSAAPAEGFDLLVMQQIRRDPTRHELTVSDVLGMWFPRLALAAAAVIALCAVGDYVSSSSAPNLTDSAAQLSEQFLTEN
jgi:hypothetical protein